MSADRPTADRPFADRRRDELAGLLERQGARVVLAPALRIVPLADDTRLRVATRELLERPPDVVVANTAIGMRGWLEAAEGWGLGEALRARLKQLANRNPEQVDAALKALDRASLSYEHVEPLTKLSGARAASGYRLRPTGTAGAKRRGVAPPRAGIPGRSRPDGPPDRNGRRPAPRWPVAVGAPLVSGGRGQLTASRRRVLGAPAAPGPTWSRCPSAGFPLDPTPLQRLVDLITNRMVDGDLHLAPAVNSLLRAAGRTPTRSSRSPGEVLAGCVGPLTAAPLVRLGCRAAGGPARALARALRRSPPAYTDLRVADAELVPWTRAVSTCGRRRRRRGGDPARVRGLARPVPRSELLEALPGADEHAVEMAVARRGPRWGRPRSSRPW
jgi:uroporphyrinogen-III synthase